LARSDPAQNYGLISAVILNKIALQRLNKLSKKLKLDIFLIIGVGSAPFRGNFSPQTAERIIQEYPWVQTYTIQSSFKYDHPPQKIADAISLLKNTQRFLSENINEEKCLQIIKKYMGCYRQQIKELAPLINKIARYLPKRRKRKLHIGLFGYSRNVSEIKLPRAINFCAALYSIGLPPEIFGINALEKNDLKYIQNIYHYLFPDFYSALQYLDINSPFLSKELKKKVFIFFPDINFNEKYLDISHYIQRSIIDNNDDQVADNLLKLAKIRNFLG